MNLKIVYWLFAFSLLLTACAAQSVQTVQPAASVIGIDPTTVTPPASLEPIQATAASTSTALSLTPAAAASTTPAVGRYWVFPPYGSGGTRAWQIENGQVKEITLPDWANNMIDHAWLTGKILHTGSFPAHGAGPANLSVGQLWLYDIQSKQNQLIFPAEDIVEAVFAPNGQDFVYLKATETTYELHWRSADGKDRLLAVDVSPTFSVSPDGKQVAFTRETGYKVGQPGVYIVPSEGGEEKKIGSADRAGAGSISDLPIWSPNGSYLLLPISSLDTPSGWVLIKTDGSAEFPLSFAPDIPPEYKQQPLAFSLWLPDSQRVLGTQLQGQMGPPYGQETGIFDLDLNSGVVTAVEPISFGNEMVLGWENPGKNAWIINDTQDLAHLDLQNPRPLPASCKAMDENWFINPFKGYCLTYPVDVVLQAFEYERPLFLGPALDQSNEPLQSRLWIEVSPLAAGTMLNQAVDDFVASQPPGDPAITRQPFTLGGEPAELLENVPGQLFSRVLLAVHNDQLYQLWFNPVDASVPLAAPEVGHLFETVARSFAYLPK